MGNKIPCFQKQMQQWSDELTILRENDLCNASGLLSFARNLGIDLSGIGTINLNDFHQRGWLPSDGVDYSSAPLFHPFRIFTLRCIHRTKTRLVTISPPLEMEHLVDAAKLLLESIPTDEQVAEKARECTDICNLAILLEPIYWPRITGRIRTSSGRIHGTELQEYRGKYKNQIVEFIRTLDPLQWQKIHESLRRDAEWMDTNTNLYLLLRVAKWEQRKVLKGSIAGALWLRHLAETIRRAFEEIHLFEWPEEDQGFQEWHPGARSRTYGSDRPLDQEMRAIPYLAHRFELMRGSVLRWYVEGKTEYYAVRHVIPEPSLAGIELVDLHGDFSKLSERLDEDREFRRFSMISFDMDVAPNVKTVRKQVLDSNVVGLIAPHAPDFEFANFTIDELVAVAAMLDEHEGHSGDAVRNENWAGINAGGPFESRYCKVSDRKPRDLKGKLWGEALARYAMDHPKRADDGSERPFISMINSALMGRIADYDLQKNRYAFDPDTFNLREAEATQIKPNLDGNEPPMPPST